MAVNVKIEQRNLEKKLTILEIAKLRNLAYGVPDDNYVLIQNEVGDHTLLYDTEHLARGIEVWFDEEFIFLSLSFPTTVREIEEFYGLVDAICQEMGIKDFYRDDNFAEIKEIDNFIEFDKNTSINTLKSLKNKVVGEELDHLEIFGVMNPISLGITELEEIDGDIENFAKFLKRLQEMDVYYAGPKVYKKKSDDTLFGVYFIGENIVSVVPNKPYIVMNQIPNINNWYVLLPEMNYVKYENFINSVQVKEVYDVNHVVICLTQEEITEIVKEFRTDI